MEEKEVVNVGELLNETIVEEIYNLGSLAPDGRKQAIEGIERLYKLRIEENKAVDDLYNNEQRIKMETERLETERQNMAKDIEIKEEQLKSEKKKMWMEIGCRGVAVAAWVLMSYKVMKFEETGSIRSKAFTGTTPKLKFW